MAVLTAAAAATDPPPAAYVYSGPGAGTRSVLSTMHSLREALRPSVKVGPRRFNQGAIWQPLCSQHRLADQGLHSPTCVHLVASAPSLGCHSGHRPAAGGWLAAGLPAVGHARGRRPAVLQAPQRAGQRALARCGHGGSLGPYLMHSRPLVRQFWCMCKCTGQSAFSLPAPAIEMRLHAATLLTCWPCLLCLLCAAEHVEGGGSYLGLCAGAYYACARVEFEPGTR